MTTYFIQAKLPIDQATIWQLAGIHAEATNGAKLSSLINEERQETIIKVCTDYLPEQFLPRSMIVLRIMTDTEECELLLKNDNWYKTNLR